MSERDGFQPGVPCWVDTGQPDPDAATGFYGELFGWEFIGPGEMPGDPPGRYFVARLKGRDVAGVSSQPGSGRPAWNTYVQVASADESASRARDAGGSVLVEPFDAPPAGRMAVLSDPQGAVFCVWEPSERKGAQVVNEPSAYAMSLLSTPDPDAATVFYGAVFGWEPEAFEGGFTVFRLPGYVGGEPQQPVPRDVVAAMGPSQDGSAAWQVDFWVSSADDAAANAAELGGTVVVEPFDTPVTRDAVLADPQGAVFMVTTAPGG